MHAFIDHWMPRTHHLGLGEQKCNAISTPDAEAGDCRFDDYPCVFDCNGDTVHSSDTYISSDVCNILLDFFMPGSLHTDNTNDSIGHSYTTRQATNRFGRRISFVSHVFREVIHCDFYHGNWSGCYAILGQNLQY